MYFAQHAHRGREKKSEKEIFVFKERQLEKSRMSRDNVSEAEAEKHF